MHFFLCLLQVMEGGQDFLREVAPPLIVAECDDEMNKAAAGYPPGVYLDRASISAGAPGGNMHRNLHGHGRPASGSRLAGWQLVMCRGTSPGSL